MRHTRLVAQLDQRMLIERGTHAKHGLDVPRNCLERSLGGCVVPKDRVDRADRASQHDCFVGGAHVSNIMEIRSIAYNADHQCVSPCLLRRIGDLHIQKRDSIFSESTRKSPTKERSPCKGVGRTRTRYHSQLVTVRATATAPDRWVEQLG